MGNIKFDYRKGFEVYPGNRVGPDGAKAPYIDHGTAAPDKTRYFSKEEADLEWQHVWTKTWAFAGLAQDVR